MDITLLIAKNPLFSDLSIMELKELKKVCRARSFQKEDIIFSEGEPAGRLFLVNTGTVKVYKVSPDGREHIIHTFGAGDCLGEAAMFAGTTYPAFAEAVAACTILSIARADLLAIIKKNPALSLKMLGALSRRLRTMVSIIEDLSLKDVEARLAKYLLKESLRKGKSPSFELNISKGALAQYLGTIPETLSRTFKKLGEKGVLTVVGKKVAIRHFDLLAKMAAGHK
jgi:CRP/FNR family transcriptional regulator, dissimilatory nitrate respiration regulator